MHGRHLGIARCQARCLLVPTGNLLQALQLATKLPNGLLQILVCHGPIVGPLLFAILGEPQNGLQMTEGGTASPAEVLVKGSAPVASQWQELNPVPHFFETHQRRNQDEILDRAAYCHP